MKDQSISRRISIAFAVVLLCTICCMASLAGVCYNTMQQVLRSQTSHSQSFVPAKRLSAAFERDILNARIHFIYFVTIQKPGARELGWERYHNADADLTALAVLVNQQDELQPLREPVARLRADYDAYDPALHDTLQMVLNGELKGAHYDAQVKEWAARGAIMVADAGTVQTLCASTSEASTDRMIKSVTESQKMTLLILFVGILLCGAVSWILFRKLKQSLPSTGSQERNSTGSANRPVDGLSASRA